MTAGFPIGDNPGASAVSELRFDYAKGEWVIIAPRRGQRPVPAGWAGRNPAGEGRDAAGRGHAEKGETSEREGVPSCPFCPGNEGATPGSVTRVPETGPWRIRVVPNRFPAVGDWDDDGPVPVSPRSSSGEPGSTNEHESLYRVEPGMGAHEVVVETPYHDRHWADFSVPELAEVLSVYRERYRALSRREGVRYVALFRNEGSAGGASQVHPHGQLIALPVVPGTVERLWERAAAYRSAYGGCLYCSVVAAERAAARRWVLSAGGFAAFCPFAPSFPYEAWIVPERHGASFADTADDELEALAYVLRSLLGALRTVLADPPFNVILRNGGGTDAGSGAGTEFHWHLQVTPRVAPLAGFELGTGMAIVAVGPEEAARELRAVVRKENGVEVLKANG